MPTGPYPELFIQDKAGKILYVANENDNTVTIIDIERRARLGDVQVGVEPEGMAISPDGRFLINTSETTNMAHFIDTQTRQIVANVLVDAHVSPNSNATAPSCGFPRRSAARSPLST